MMHHLKTLPRLSAFAVAGALTLSGCGDDLTRVEEHGDAVSLELMLDGAVAASFDFDTRTWAGTLEVDEGEETTHIDVGFFDEDGNELHFDDEPDYYLEVDVANDAIADFEQDTPGEFGGHLHGVAAGETELVFKLMHGAVGSGHADLVTEPLIARVN